MKNTYTTPADFWQVRDFGAKISAVFEFIGAHWRPLGKCLVYFVLPGALLLGIGLGLFTNPLYNQMGKTLAAQRAGAAVAPAGNPLAANLAGALGLGVALVGGILAVLLLLSTVYGYLRARLELPAAEPVTPAAVWAQVRRRLGKMLAVVALVMVGYAVLMLGYVLVLGTLVGHGGGMASAVGGVVLGFFLLLAAVTYLAIVFALYFPVLWLEEVSVFGALRRSFQLIRGNWWATFGLLLVISFIQGAVSVVFLVPFYATMFGKMLQIPVLKSDVAGLMGTTLYSVGSMFAYVLTLLGAAFQYFNLAEQREGHGLRLLVDELGQPQAVPTAYSHHYRPEEEQY